MRIDHYILLDTFSFFFLILNSIIKYTCIQIHLSDHQDTVHINTSPKFDKTSEEGLLKRIFNAGVSTLGVGFFSRQNLGIFLHCSQHH